MESPPAPVVHFRSRRILREQVEATAGPALFPPGSTSITVRDCRAIGRWDSVVKKFRLAGRSDSAAERTTLSLCSVSIELRENFRSHAPVFNVAHNYLNIGGMNRRRAADYGGASCPLARIRLTAS
jgi:hypothetical protein